MFYIAGWQPRWFILDDGILSYYNSQDEVGKGCKGSIKMSVCDVIGLYLNDLNVCIWMRFSFAVSGM